MVPPKSGGGAYRIISSTLSHPSILSDVMKFGATQRRRVDDDDEMGHSRHRRSLLRLTLATAVSLSTIARPTCGLSSSTAAGTFTPPTARLRLAVIIPGFLSGSDTFAPMVESLAETHGIKAMVVPLTVQDWIPCLGGRSVRPILERIDATVQFMAAQEIGPMPFRYNLSDLWQDMSTNPGGFLKVGGTDVIDEYPNVEPAGIFPRTKRPAAGKIALIGHSAGGWIGRVYCSSRPYGGRPQAYNGHERIHSLITLGTPHYLAPGPAFAGIAWCDLVDEEEEKEHVSSAVRRLAVAGTGFAATEWGTLTRNSYAFCGHADADGDGITPVDSALAWKGAERMTIPNVTHFPWSETTGASLVAPELTKDHGLGTRSWYGSRPVVEQWARWLVKDDD